VASVQQLSQQLLSRDPDADPGPGPGLALIRHPLAAHLLFLSLTPAAGPCPRRPPAARRPLRWNFAISGESAGGVIQRVAGARRRWARRGRAAGGRPAADAGVSQRTAPPGSLQ
jgi:hypothetical protein